MAASEQADGVEEDEDAALTAATPEPDKDAFFHAFRAEHQAIRDLLAVARSGPEESAATVNGTMDAMLVKTQNLEADFTRIAHSLTRYDEQHYRASLRELEVEIAKQREHLAPRKKFSFKRREPATQGAGKATESEQAAKEAAGGYGASAASPAPAPAPALAPEFLGELFEDMEGSSVARGAGELAGRDVTLRNLKGCRVVLLDRIGALHCHGLRSCEIVIGAISSSALLYDCKDCELTFVAKQLRLHDSEHIALHLHTLSGPVIEHCRRVLISSHDLSYPGAEAHWAAADLGTPGVGVTWSDMQDFNWHRRQASPNWRVVPAERRRPRLEIEAAKAFAERAPLPPADLGAGEGLFVRCRDLWEEAPAAPIPSAISDFPAAVAANLGASNSLAPGEDDEF